MSLGLQAISVHSKLFIGSFPSSPRIVCLLCVAQVYDSGNGLLAPRVWWCLSYYGHPAPLILDGGYARWVKEGRNTELAEPCPLTASPDFQQWHTGCNHDQRSALQGSSGQNRTSKVTYNFLPCCHSVHHHSHHQMAVLEGMWARWGLGTLQSSHQFTSCSKCGPFWVCRLTDQQYTLRRPTCSYACALVDVTDVC